MYIIRLNTYSQNHAERGWSLHYREVKTNAEAQKTFEHFKTLTRARDEVTIELNGRVIHFWVNKGEAK